MTRRLLVALLATLALLGGPAAAALASGRDVLNDCTADEVMSKTYTQKEYRDALAQLQGDTDQYGNCRDVIKRAQLKAAAAGAATKKGGSAGTSSGGGGGGGTSAGGTSTSTGGGGAIGSAPAKEQLQAATPTERKAVDAARADSRAFQAGTAKVDPEKVGTVPGVSRVSDLPTPLVAVLVLLLAAALAVGGLRIRSLVNARRA
jgi:hypothetical protein